MLTRYGKYGGSFLRFGIFSTSLFFLLLFGFGDPMLRITSIFLVSLLFFYSFYVRFAYRELDGAGLEMDPIATHDRVNQRKEERGRKDEERDKQEDAKKVIKGSEYELAYARFFLFQSSFLTFFVT